MEEQLIEALQYEERVKYESLKLNEKLLIQEIKKFVRDRFYMGSLYSYFSLYEIAHSKFECVHSLTSKLDISVIESKSIIRKKHLEEIDLIIYKQLSKKW